MHEIGEKLGRVGVDVPGHAVIDEAEPDAGVGRGERLGVAVGLGCFLDNEDISWVRVGVEEADLEALAEDGVGADRDDVATLVVGEFVGFVAREQHALDLLKAEMCLLECSG